MPITRRRRANPPEQPEQTNPTIETTEQNSAPTADNNNSTAEGASEAPKEAASPKTTRARSAEAKRADVAKANHAAENSAASTTQATQPAADVTGTHGPAASGSAQRSERTESSPTPSPTSGNTYQQPFPGTTPPVTPVLNGERGERPENSEQHHGHAVRPERFTRIERQEYAPSIEGGRRTARGELFRRPPQPPNQAQHVAPPTVAAAPLQPPSHEISLPLGNLLHLAYNPGYTGSEEARSELLQHLTNESKAGGRARCWSCGSLAIVYDRWNTRSKTFGEVGVAICEICGVWSVM